jgi:hypothetical protein
MALRGDEIFSINVARKSRSENFGFFVAFDLPASR